MNRDAISLRPIRPEDGEEMEFLYRVYASTRTEELAPVPWSGEEKEEFLRMQFQAQHVYYREHYGEADFLVILNGGEPIGRLYVQRWPDDIRLVDIALLPEHRGGGIGGALVRELLAEGEREGKTVSIHVERFNPAMRLYERLGFEKKGEAGVYHLMAWSPPARRREEDVSCAG